MKNSIIKENIKRNDMLIVVLAVVIVLVLFRGWGMMRFGNSWTYGMMNGFYEGLGFMWLFGWLLMILFVVASILFIFWLIKNLGVRR